MRMNKEEFIQFVAKNLKYHLPSDFNSYQIEVNHMRLTISESNSSKQLNVYLNRAYEQFVQAIRMQKSRSQGMKIPVIRMISSMLQWEMYRLAITKSMTADMNVSIS